MRATSKFLVLVGVLACGLTPAVAFAQDPSTSTTDTLGDYTSTLPTVTAPATTTPATTTPTTPEGETAPTTTNEVAGEGESGGDEPTTDAATTPGAATPPESTPRALAFTGADSVLLLLLGAALAGSALWLLRRGDRPS